MLRTTYGNLANQRALALDTEKSNLINSAQGDATNPYTEKDMQRFCAARVRRAQQLRGRLIDAKVDACQVEGEDLPCREKAKSTQRAVDGKSSSG